MIVLRISPGLDAAQGLLQVKLIATRFPGEHELTLLVPRDPQPDPATGEMRETALSLGLGPAWRYDASPACLAALAEFGTVAEPNDVNHQHKEATHGRDGRTDQHDA